MGRAKGGARANVVLASASTVLLLATALLVLRGGDGNLGDGAPSTARYAGTDRCDGTAALADITEALQQVGPELAGLEELVVRYPDPVAALATAPEACDHATFPVTVIDGLRAVRLSGRGDTALAALLVSELSRDLTGPDGVPVTSVQEAYLDVVAAPPPPTTPLSTLDQPADCAELRRNVAGMQVSTAIAGMTPRDDGDHNERVTAFWRSELGCDDQPHPLELLDLARELRPTTWVEAVRWGRVADPRNLGLDGLRGLGQAVASDAGFPEGMGRSEAVIVDAGAPPVTWAAFPIRLEADMGRHLVEGRVGVARESNVFTTTGVELELAFAVTELGHPDARIVGGRWTDNDVAMTDGEAAVIQALVDQVGPGKPAAGEITVPDTVTDRQPLLLPAARGVSDLFAHAFLGFGNAWHMPGVPLGVGAVWEAPDGELRCQLLAVATTDADIECTRPLGDEPLHAPFDPAGAPVEPATSSGTAAIQLRRAAGQPVPFQARLERTVAHTYRVDGRRIVVQTSVSLSMRPLDGA